MTAAARSEAKPSGGRALLPLALVLLVPSVARAESPLGEHGIGTLVWHGLNLAILLAVIVHFTRKPVLDFFRRRHDQVRGDLEAAGKVLSEAEERLRQWQARADRLDAEVDRIKEEARERAARERERIVADAQAAAERIRRDAAAAVDQEVLRARAELRAEAADLATELAADLVRRHVTPEDQKRLVDEFIARIEAGGAGAAGAGR